MHAKSSRFASTRAISPRFRMSYLASLLRELSGEKTIGVPAGFPPLRRHYRLRRLASKREEVAGVLSRPERMSRVAGWR
ncbi:hypothetical protein ACLB2K_007583 [Fragaria x ananassa]